jgi:hypothetical protein
MNLASTDMVRTCRRGVEEPARDVVIGEESIKVGGASGERR